MKVAVVSCYKYPDYMRTVTLGQALGMIDGVEVVIVKNTAPGPLRYLQVFWGLIKCRFRSNPDVWLIAFRGYEILPFVRILAGRKPLIFDEFINPLEVTEEHRQQRNGTFIGLLMGFWKYLALPYYFFLRRCQAVLMDTQVHADYAAQQSNMDAQKYFSVPVSTDEELFSPNRQAKSDFEVLYYGSMVPLHGLEYVLESAVELKDDAIHFRIIGGEKRAEQLIKDAQAKGGKIIYTSRVPLKSLPQSINAADICLGGPFGKTLQSNMVVTGKTYQFLACAAPAMIGKNDATQDLFVDKQNCLLVNQADSKAITSALRWALKHPQELEVIGKNGRQLYDKHFSVKQISLVMGRVLSTLSTSKKKDRASSD